MTANEIEYLGWPCEEEEEEEEEYVRMCDTCGGAGEVMCPGYAGRGCGPGEDQFGRLCSICQGSTMVECPDCDP